jgi:hypothetical protein
VRRLLILFGAGASYGSNSVLPHPPPLGKDLYPQLAAEFPAAWGVKSPFHRYDADLRRDFEETMFNRVCDRVPTLTLLESHQKMALYFSQFTIGNPPDNLYYRLLAFLQEKGLLANTTLASLNYDCLIEQAVAALGLEVDYYCDRPSKDCVRLLKPHGSCHFITADISAQRYQLTNPNSMLGCKMNILPTVLLLDRLTSHFSDLSAGYYPIMSVYTWWKNTNIAVGTIEKIRNSWTEYANKASTIAIIGASFANNDDHITDAIQNTGTERVLYIGGTSEYEKWRALNGNIHLVSNRFQDGFERLCDELASP